MWDAEITLLEKQKVKSITNHNENLHQIAQDGLEASLNLGEWQNFSQYIKILQRSTTPNSFEKNFYQAILDIKNHQY